MLLIATVCYVLQPSRCYPQTIVDQYAGWGMQQCMLLSQQEMAAWINTHPLLKVVKWKCESPGRVDRDI
jgi:hypothetical protein